MAPEHMTAQVVVYHSGQREIVRIYVSPKLDLEWVKLLSEAADRQS